MFIPIPETEIPQPEPLPVSASVPLHEPLPISAAVSPVVLPEYSAAVPAAPVSVKKRRLAAERVSPRRVVTAGLPVQREEKKFRTRGIKTAAQKNPARKRNRRPAVVKEQWVETERMPVSCTGTELGLPVGFGIQLGVLMPQYPLRAEDCLALTVASEEKCYIAVVQYDAEGKPSLIVPGAERENTVVFPHMLTRFPQPSCADYELVVESPFGPVRLVLLACTAPCDWGKVYREALSVHAPTPTPGRLEAAMIASTPAAEVSPIWSSATLVLLTCP